MRNEVRPYLVPALDTVDWNVWRLLEGQVWEPLPGAVDGWDPGTDLRIQRAVQMDVARFRRETGLALEEVVLTASWTSSTTNMTEAAPPVRFDSSGVAVMDTVLIGERLSGALSLRTTIALARTPDQLGPGVATVPGAVLAEDVYRVMLENVSAMFPVHEMDFARTSLPATASWHLETTTDLTAPFYSTFRLLINTRDRELCAAVARGGKDKRQRALIDELQAGVACMLLELALHLRQELAEQYEWPLDSVGDILARTLAVSPLPVQAPPSAFDLAEFRTHISGAVRDIGRGRTFL